MNIIQARDGRLWDGQSEFRFLGLAAPNLHLNECQVHPDFSNRFPDEFEIRDTLESIAQLGGLATRVFCLSLETSKDPGVAAHLRSPSEFNEQAFIALDRVFAIGAEIGVRVIVPLIDSHSFPGWRGVDEWAAWSGKSGGEFWTDPQLKQQFKACLTQMLHRRNSLTGVLYKDEPAVLAWQVGNELDSWAPDRGLDGATWTGPLTQWTLEIAAHLKSIDPLHVVMEAGGDRKAYLESPHIDALSDHYYEYWNLYKGVPGDLASMNRSSLALIDGRKPLIVDEFGMATMDNLRGLMAELHTSTTSGALLWSLRSHRRDGGFYVHNENGSPYNAYHWPGFPSGDPYDETEVMTWLEHSAWSLRGRAVPARPAPAKAPKWLGSQPVVGTSVRLLRWRGVTGASHYQIDRRVAVGDSHAWVTLATRADDAPALETAGWEASGTSTPAPQFADLTALASITWEYRVRGGNVTGWGPWSEAGS